MMTNKKTQAGGTFLGLIIGLIVGLSIAVVVAFVISKTPLPFTNKGSTPIAPSTTSDLDDPNKPMYGKKPQILQPDTAASATAATASAPTLVPTITNQSAPPPVASKPPATAKGNAPDKVEAAKTDAAKAENSDEKWIYYLQAGAFRDADDADNLKAKLALLGFEASVSDREADSGMLHRVRIGPFGQAETMNRVRGKLSDNGIDVAVVRIAK